MSDKNQIQTSRINIVVDNIVFSLQKTGGISVFWYEILKRLNSDNKFNVTYLDFKDCQQNLFRNYLNISPKSIIRKSNLLIGFRKYFNPIYNTNNVFVFHSSYYRICNNKNAINITTVHDFTYEKYYHGLAKWLHCNQKYASIKKSDIVICISENTKNDLLTYLPDIDINKIKVVYNGVSEEYFPIEKSFDFENYILFVGSRLNYKRFDLAIDVLSNSDFKLLIVGGGELSSNELSLLNKKLGVNNYEYLGTLTNEELNKFYNKAFCLLYPSEYEGFGIPIIEAQKAGCPIIAFNGSSVSEIAGDSNTLFNKHNVEEIILKIEYLSNKENRIREIESGFINASKFSWDISVEKYLEIYNNAYIQRKMK